MSDIQKVYIVEEGEYSDRHICAVFATREEAETYCAVHTEDEWDTYAIHEYEMGRISVAPVQYVYQVRTYLFETATLRYATGEAMAKSSIEQCGRISCRGGEKCNIIDCNDHPGRTVVLRERNKEKAIKIVQDRIAKAKAEREGL